MRITDQYFWQIVFTVFFITLVVLATIILQSEAYKTPEELVLVDYILITLASFRMIRLFVYDKITAFFREQFYDVKKVRTQVQLVKPERGPKRALLELLLCPWCFGIWAAALITFLYMLTPLFWYPILFLALAGVATFLQLLSNLIGNKAEQLKPDTD